MFPEDSPFWLPLYGNMCCRLVAQPLCMIQPVIIGQLKVKVTWCSYIIPPFDVFFILYHIIIHCITSLPALNQLGEGLNCWENVYGVLRGQSLLCYQSQEGLESEDKSLLVIPIKKVGSKWAKSHEWRDGLIYVFLSMLITITCWGHQSALVN